MKKLALISVHNKNGIVDFTRELVEKYNYEILSTGGTSETLRKNNIPVVEVSTLTGFPEMLEGRVKTLHPVVHAALLARRDKAEHMETIAKNNIRPIDLVVVNLYPFEEVSSKPGMSLEEVIENIDIGGPTLLRSAAKNYSAVTVVCDPSDYLRVLDELAKNNGKISLGFRESLSLKVFSKTKKYDSSIESFFASRRQISNGDNKDSFPENLNLNLKLKQVLRYGENPHQKASLYLSPDSKNGLANAKLLQGKELSFNNYLDLESAWNIVSEFDANIPACVVVKHNNPCGVAIAPDLHHAYIEAFYADSVSAFGSIIGFNNVVDEKVVGELIKVFIEAVVAPGFTKEALELFRNKPNVRLVDINFQESSFNKLDVRTIDGGFLVQDYDWLTLNPEDLKVVTKKQPTKEEFSDIVFAWKICKHVKSNAIVVAKDGKTLGIGAGQTSRVASVEIALKHANYNSKGSVLASDGFFPFKDSIEIAAQAQISTIIQPGGSKKDQEVIDACDKYGIAMVFTGIRHFKH